MRARGEGKSYRFPKQTSTGRGTEAGQHRPRLRPQPGILPPSFYGEVVSVPLTVARNMPNAASEIVGPSHSCPTANSCVLLVNYYKATRVCPPGVNDPSVWLGKG